MKSKKKIIRRAIIKLVNKLQFSRAYTEEDRKRDQEKILANKRRTSKKTPNPHKKPGDAYLKRTDLNEIATIALKMYTHSTVNLSKIAEEIADISDIVANAERTKLTRQLMHIGGGFDFKRANIAAIKNVLNSEEVQSRIRAGQKVWGSLDPTDFTKKFFIENWINKKEFHENGRTAMSCFEAVSAGHCGVGEDELRARIMAAVLVFEDGTKIPLSFALVDPSLQDIQLMEEEMIKIFNLANFPIHFLCDSGFSKHATMQKLQTNGMDFTTRLTANPSIVIPEDRTTQNIELCYTDIIDEEHEFLFNSLSRDINVDNPVTRTISYKGFDITFEESTSSEAVGLYLSNKDLTLDAKVLKAIDEGVKEIKVPTVVISMRDSVLGASKKDQVTMHTTLELSPYTFAKYSKKMEEKRKRALEKAEKASQAKEDKRTGNVSLQSYDNPFVVRAIAIKNKDKDDAEEDQKQNKKKEEEKKKYSRTFMIIASTCVSGIEAIRSYEKRFAASEVYNKMIKQPSHQSGSGFMDLKKFRVFKYVSLELIVWIAFLISLASTFTLLQYDLETLSKMLTNSEGQAKDLLKRLLAAKNPIYRLLMKFKKLA